jgi:hypothetical protein
MHTYLHYFLTKKFLSELDAQVSFACDIDPAKTVLHRRMYIEGGGLYEALGLPEEYIPGVMAHVVEDALWEAFVRPVVKKGKEMWVHRLHETFWVRSWLRAPPPIDLTLVTRFLRLFEGFSEERARRQMLILAWLVTAPEEEVKAYFWDRIGYRVEPEPWRLEEAYDEDRFLRALEIMLNAKPWARPGS